MTVPGPTVHRDGLAHHVMIRIEFSFPQTMCYHHASRTARFICWSEKPAQSSSVAQQIKKIWRDAGAEVIDM